MNKATDKEQDRALQAAMQRRAAQVPPLADDFAERVMAKMNARRQRARRYRLSAALTGIAAAVFVAFLFWPESHEMPITQPEQPVIAEVTSPKTEPKENVGAEVPAAQTHVSARKHVAVEPKPQHAIHEPVLVAEPVLAKATRTDSFDYYLAHLEAEMDALDDSVSSAQLEKLISADARLRQLVNRIVGSEVEQALNAAKPDSTTDYLNF